MLDLREGTVRTGKSVSLEPSTRSPGDAPRGLDWSARARLRLLGIRAEELDPAHRGFFPGNGAAKQRFGEIDRAFLQGYRCGLSRQDAERLSPDLNRIADELRGFAFEGAAMAWRLLDYFLPRPEKPRLGVLSAGIGKAQLFMVHLGAGWAFARVPWARERDLGDLDPLLKWLPIDGYGFHQSYFDWRRYVERRKTPWRLSSYGRRAFDQGVGRSLWFVEGADADQVAWRADAFPPPRRNDIWSGLGLAAAYAGGASREALDRLKEISYGHRWDLAQGAALAAAVRSSAGNSAPHTDLACHVFCGIDGEQAARLTRDAARGLVRGEVPRYEIWRMRVRSVLARRRLGVPGT